MATVVLIGTAVVAVVSGLYTAVVSSDQHKRQTRAAAEVTNIVEVIEALPYQPCTASGLPNYAAQLPALPSGYTLLPVVIEPLASRTATSANWTSACPGIGDQGAQRITLEVVQGTGNRQVEERLVYVKRDDRCPGTTTTLPSGEEPQC